MRRRTADRGAVIPLVALALTVIMVSVAFAVDLGRQGAERRDMQAIADMISMDLTRRLEGRDAGTIAADPAFHSALQASAARNGHPAPAVPCPPGDIVGRCVSFALGAVDASHAFTPCPDPACTPSAVQVTAGADVEYFFQPGSGDTRRVAVARVADNEEGYFTVGSSLVSLDPTSRSVVAQILQRSIPDAQLLSYEGLVAAEVNVERLRRKLNIPVTLASPQELLDTTVTFRQLAIATLEVLHEDDPGNAAAISALNDFRDVELPSRSVSWGRLIGIGAGVGGSPAATMDVNFLQMIAVGAFLIDGEHFATVPGSTLGIPGLASLGIRMTGIEAPRTGGPDDGDWVETSQVRVELTPQLNIASDVISQQVCSLPTGEQTFLKGILGSLIDTTKCLLSTALWPSPLPLRAEIYGSPTITLDIAKVIATQSLDCPAATLTVATTPSVVDLLGNVELTVRATLDSKPIGDLAKLVYAAGARTTGAGASTPFVGVAPGTPLPTGVRYDQFTPSQARVGANPMGLSGMLRYDAATVQVFGNGVQLPNLTNRVLTNLVEPALDQAMNRIDTIVIERLSRLLGIHFGGADIRPISLRCDESSVLLVA